MKSVSVYRKDQDGWFSWYLCRNMIEAEKLYLKFVFSGSQAVMIDGHWETETPMFSSYDNQDPSDELPF